MILKKLSKLLFIGICIYLSSTSTAFASSGQVTVPGVRIYNQNTDFIFCLQLSSIINEKLDIEVTYYDYNGDIVTEGSVTGDLFTTLFVNDYVEGTDDYTAKFSLPSHGSGQMCLRAFQAEIDTVGKIIIKWDSSGNHDTALMGIGIIQRRYGSSEFSEGVMSLNGGKAF
jgi:hypothetical protein